MFGKAAAAESDRSGGEDECPWCKFMKGGPCRKVFEVWQSCVDGVADSTELADTETRQKAVEKCAGVTGPLFECLANHPEYYGQQLNSMAERSKGEKQQAAAGGAEPGNSSSSSRAASSSDNKHSHSSGTSAATTVAEVQGQQQAPASKLGTAVA